jgi:ribosomal protein L16/L10AE
VLAALEEGKSEEEAFKLADSKQPFPDPFQTHVACIDNALLLTKAATAQLLLLFSTSAESGVLAALEEGKSKEEAFRLADSKLPFPSSPILFERTLYA